MNNFFADLPLLASSVLEQVARNRRSPPRARLLDEDEELDFQRALELSRVEQQQQPSRGRVLPQQRTEADELDEVAAVDQALFGQQPAFNNLHASDGVTAEEAAQIRWMEEADRKAKADAELQRRTRERLDRERRELEEQMQLRLVMEASEREAQLAAFNGGMPPRAAPGVGQYEAAVGEADVPVAMDIEHPDEDPYDEEMQRALDLSRQESQAAVQQAAQAAQQAVQSAELQNRLERARRLRAALEAEEQALAALQNPAVELGHEVPDYEMEENEEVDEYQRAVEQSLQAAEREERLRVREEQDKRYEESLERDKEKERQKKEEERKQRELEEAKAHEERRLREEKDQQELAEAIKLSEGLSAEQQRLRKAKSLVGRLAPPADPQRENVFQVIIRLPKGDRIEASFAPDRHTIRDVREFVDSRLAVNPERYADLPENYKLLTSFPKKELAELGQTLAAAGVTNRSVLLVEAL